MYTTPPSDTVAEYAARQDSLEEAAEIDALNALERAIEWESIMRKGGDAPRREDASSEAYERALWEARRRRGLDREVPGWD